jgi:hypothetical protein
MLKRFFHYKGKMRTLGTIAIVIITLVLVFFKSFGKHILRLIDLHSDLGQIGKLHGSTILIYKRFDVESVEMEISIFYFKTILGKIKCLLYQVGVSVIAQCFVQVLTV